MKIYTEIPESTKPEKAWVEEKILEVDFHLYHKEMFYYIDAHATIAFENIIEFVMIFGARKGFKGMRLTYRDIQDRHVTMLKLSNNHEELILQIYNLLKRAGLTARREIYTGKEVKN
jgi:hypothetical protein